jgi:hypothetical protein
MLTSGTTDRTAMPRKVGIHEENPRMICFADIPDRLEADGPDTIVFGKHFAWQRL